MIHWQDTGEIFDTKKYAACPTIRYLDGYYYVLYLRSVEEKFITRIARSRDLRKWEFSAEAVLIPVANEGINASDVDLVEADGVVYFTYAIGDQKTFADIKIAKYRGNLNTLLQHFNWTPIE